MIIAVGCCYTCNTCVSSCICTNCICNDCSASNHRYKKNIDDLTCSCLPGYYDDGVNPLCPSKIL